ncbi:hypothetical protein ABT354_20245 [Streptomyces sp. NPDC000594]|uniref:hypothetical protein n=1 Tax=Streptomyces sp. NPDC000594 TaxID=3154261 RepID=UPI00331AA741
MTTIIEQVQRWKAEGGPDVWQAAWERVIDLGRVPWDGKDMVLDAPVAADGAAALATLLYITASEEGIHPRDVTHDQVIRFREASTAGTAPGFGEEQAYWERRLTALGHDLEDPTDPVAVMWRRITIDYRPPRDALDEAWEDSFTRWGPGFSSGLRKVFTPPYKVTLD